MISPAALPTWERIFANAALKPLKRGRGCCPFCDSRTGFSCNEIKGFHCFACGVKGDKISFIQALHECDFKGALRFFGIEAGRPPILDPAIERRQKARAGLLKWAHELQRKYRDEFYLRSKIELFGKWRLEKDPEDRIGWELLSVAYQGIPLVELENWLDLLIGKEEQQLEAYYLWRAAA